ncbi:uncharacterized protein BJ171DRAFT_473600 [Polychytrium aggregatum]|uniref:uncharacterized protein n=1 Tax=Polychytrium aggregatum TaxID=110093 RepID=UPI0022FF1222|nr:uncharacterized protein BJ171DRAFT_473600 [Polychytrium aggregatum]KAI9206076.1 hypothetical protein BJ171DRAFT_473600 [Polychytrium aggregatum]
MSWFIEKSILDHLGVWIRTNGYQLSDHEKQCVKSYDTSPQFYLPANFVLWGGVAYSTLNFNPKVMPRWLQLFGVVGISAGAFATVYWSSKYAAKSCVQCFVDTQDKKSELYKTTIQILKQYHHNPKEFLDKERHSPSMP